MSREQFPSRLRPLIERRDLEFFRSPDIQSTDQKIKQDRKRFGDHVVFVVVIVEKNGSFAIVRYSAIPLPGGWTMPGGVVEMNEGIEEAAVREAREETGLDVKLLSPLALIMSAFVAPSEGKFDSYGIIYHAKAISGKLEPIDHREIDKARLATIQEIEALISRGEFHYFHQPLGEPIIQCLRKLVLGMMQ